MSNIKRLRDFSDPDLVSQSYMMPGENKCLRQISLDLLMQWSLLLADLLKTKDLYAKLSRYVGDDCASLFIEKQLFLELKLIVQAYVRRVAIKYDGGDSWKKPIFISDRNLFILLENIKKDKDIQFINRRNLFVEFIKFIRIFTYNIFLSKYQVLDDSQNNIGVSIVEGVSLKNRRNELFWWDGALPKPSNLFCLFEGDILYPGQVKATADLLKQNVVIRRTNNVVKLEDYLIKKNSIISHPYLHFFLRFFTTTNSFNSAVLQLKVPKLLFKKFRIFNNKSLWLEDRVGSWLFIVRWWSNFFKKNNIKLWMVANEESSIPVAQRAAIEKNGGLTLYRQRSEGSGYPDWLGEGAAHISFVFNDRAIESMERMRNRNILSIPVGHTFGVSKSINYEETKFYREKLTENGASFIVAFFDNPCSIMQDVSREQTVDLYCSLLNLVISDSSIGLLIKSKFGSLISDIISAIPDIWDQAFSTGRVFNVTDHKLLPIIISKASDVTIGVQISTAAMESAISGLRTLYYYPSSAGEHLFEQKMMNILVFRSVKEIMIALKSIKNGDVMIGNSNSIIDEIDSYADGKGPQRMSLIINELLKSKNQNMFTDIMKYIQSEPIFKRG